MEPLRADPKLAPLVEEHGEIDLEPHPDPFRRLVVSIVNQQLSTASAAAIRERVFDRFEVTPAALLSADEDSLRETGLSASKVEYVKNVAEAFEERPLTREYFDGVPDEDVVSELTEIRGVGVWTAKMYLLFCLAREDVFPVEDLGIRRGMQLLYGEDLSRPEMVETAEAWRPYRSYASRYLWRAYEG